MTSLGRREFLWALAAGSLAGWSGCQRPGADDLADEPLLWVSDLTALALLHDGLALARLKASPGPAMREAMEMRFDGFSLGLLWREPDPPLALLEGAAGPLKLGAATGSLMIDAAAAQMRRTLRRRGLRPEQLDRARPLHDAAVARSFLKTPPKREADARALLQTLDQRLRIRIHTYRPDPDDVIAWVSNLIAWDDAQREAHDRLAGLMVRPSSVDWRRFVEGLNFLASDDALLPRIRAGLEPEALPQSPSVPAAGESAYRLALDAAEARLRLTDRFLQGDLAAEAFRDAISEA